MRCIKHGDTLDSLLYNAQCRYHFCTNFTWSSAVYYAGNNGFCSHNLFSMCVLIDLSSCYASQADSHKSHKIRIQVPCSVASCYCQRCLNHSLQYSFLYLRNVFVSGWFLVVSGLINFIWLVGDVRWGNLTHKAFQWPTKACELYQAKFTEFCYGALKNLIKETDISHSPTIFSKERRVRTWNLFGQMFV